MTEQQRNITVSESELKRQKHYIEKIREKNDIEYSRTGKKLLMYQATFGCQMNAHDSEKIKGILIEMGYESTEKEKDADIIIYNTCCVRENAENKVYGNLGFLKHMKKEKPNLKIVLCGCMMQQDTVIEKIKSTYKHVDIIFGTFNLHRFPELLYTNMESGGTIIDVWEEHGEIVEDLPVIREFKFKSSVNIMYGCNNFCSYCIVPYVRGRERSREPEEIIQEIENLVADGVKEVTLLGQNVNSYGLGLKNETTFAELLIRINRIEGLKRIRFMTSHPKDLSEELIYAMRDCEKVCNHLHLPVQAGSNNLLNKMNRKYTIEQYLDLVEKIKKEIPNIAITTDIIVGFPGETEEDFLQLLDVVKKVQFAGAFTFIYSIRTGTPAANMENQIPHDIVKERFNRLLDVLNPIIYDANKKHIGQTLNILAEEVNKQDNTLLTGRSEDNSIVHFRGSESLIGDICKVKITDCKTFYLMGESI